MTLAALLLHPTGLLLAFGPRTLLARLRTGDTAFRRPETTPFSPDWWGTVLFAAALLPGLAAPVAALAGLPPAPAASSPGSAD
ncbi:hypothetical protein [Actinorugispora endophytica]|uniref:Uncharacterized protein n=1 Tax=Actinorugispora endophytica TaxID=1605990 RepID=A0A4R6UPW3_9ACTN|nr:hypothetical protein [Actinorugispora endophytica]TDQ49268.1 hypothetical protein EV190_11664 [Actinorugispora endophytica]